MADVPVNGPVSGSAVSLDAAVAAVQAATGSARDSAVALAGRASAAGQAAVDAALAVRPLLRGWLHASLTPLALAAGTVLVCVAPSGPARWSAAVWMVVSVLLFGTSAAYHRRVWGPVGERRLKRADHANIYLNIAGTYTPFAVLGLHGRAQAALLTMVWGGALAGVLFRLCWLNAPRWLYTPLYVVLGVSALAFLPELFAGAGVAVMTLTSVGGAVYVAGAVMYGLKRPNPWPRVWGFHEFFHAATVVAWTVQAVAVFLLVCRA